MVEAIHNVEIVLGVHGDTGWPVELAVSVPVFPPPLGELPVIVEDGNAVQPLIGDVDVLLAVQGDAHRPYQLSFRVAVASELADPLLVAWHGPDCMLAYLRVDGGLVPGHVGDLLLLLGKDVDVVARPDGDAHRMAPIASADGMAEVICPAAYYLCKHRWSSLWWEDPLPNPDVSGDSSTLP